MNNPTHPENSVRPPSLSENVLDKVNFGWETARLWLTQAWRIAFLMARGAYLTQERRNLFKKLGEEVYVKIQKGELRNVDLENQMSEINRLTKKLELSEIKIRSIRFGKQSPVKNQNFQEPSGNSL